MNFFSSPAPSPEPVRQFFQEEQSPLEDPKTPASDVSIVSSTGTGLTQTLSAAFFSPSTTPLSAEPISSRNVSVETSNATGDSLIKKIAKCALAVFACFFIGMVIKRSLNLNFINLKQIN